MKDILHTDYTHFPEHAFFPSCLHTLSSFCSFVFISFSEARFCIPCWPQTHGSLLSQLSKSESHVSHHAWPHSWILAKLSLLFGWKFPSLAHAAWVWTVMGYLLFFLKCRFLPDLFLSTPMPELSLLGTKATQQLLGSLLAPRWCVAPRGFSYSGSVAPCPNCTHIGTLIDAGLIGL